MSEPTRSEVQRNVASVRILSGSTGSGSTRSADYGIVADSLFYVVDFENGAGFALIAADRRIPDEMIIAVGHGSFTEGTDNPGFAIMMSRADDYAINSILEHERWKDSVEVAMLTRLKEERPELAETIGDYLSSGNRYAGNTRSDGDPIEGPDRVALVYTTNDYSDWVVEGRVAPMTPVEWGQGWPFNTTVVANTRWNNTPAGCVPIAIVQLMAYWQWPLNYGGISINWPELCRYTGGLSDMYNGYKTWADRMFYAPANIQKMCADLVYKVAVGVKTTFGENGSAAYDKDALNFLKSLGYTVPSSMTNYSYNPVILSLNNHRPVYFGGYSSKSSSGTYSGGHAWLIDG